MESVSTFGRYTIKFIVRDRPSPPSTEANAVPLKVPVTTIILRDEEESPVMVKEEKAVSASSSGASLSIYNDVTEYIFAKHDKEEYRAARRLRNVAAVANDHSYQQL